MSYYPAAGLATSQQVPGPPVAYSTSTTIQPGTFAAVTTGTTNITITLASATGAYRVKKVDSGSGMVTVVGPAGAKFDGGTNLTIPTQYQSNDLTGNGTDFHVT